MDAFNKSALQHCVFSEWYALKSMRAFVLLLSFCGEFCTGCHFLLLLLDSVFCDGTVCCLKYYCLSLTLAMDCGLLDAKLRN